MASASHERSEAKDAVLHPIQPMQYDNGEQRSGSWVDPGDGNDKMMDLSTLCCPSNNATNRVLVEEYSLQASPEQT